jgi:hypothetical protein
MDGPFIIKKTWLSAFSYAQSRILLVFCHSLGFFVPWFSSFLFAYFLEGVQFQF